MMLSEHREQFLEQRRSLNKHEKPSLDEQRLEELSSILNYALATKNKVRIPFTMFTKISVLLEKIKKYDPLTRSLWINSDRVTPRASETKSIKSTD
ncbi:YolD-like family protein [Paenibacillus larvae]|nr:YolD-like family protein [Paenibacillus larvae]AQZ49311.1 hypothetical protein B5S25_22685 [Paenibacillus larvae subsp. pulvifaciens]MEC0184895.1 YolD-like family protein [Paenibacillus larvae]